MKFSLRLLSLVLFLAFLFTSPCRAIAQAGSLHGTVVDPTGAVIPRAHITLTQGDHVLQQDSGADGRYAFRAVPAGNYTLGVTANGFAPLALSNVSVQDGQSKELKLSLVIAIQQQEVTVSGQNQGVSINPDQNGGAMVLKDSDLDALSDDPDELQNELQALAGPAAGPNGGQIYIDGFAGGQIPPKSSILEIRVNQNPFSAEYDRIGYGRVEIITKPGTQKLHGSVSSFGSTSALNTANPLVSSQPAYDLYSFFGNITGPLGKTASYFFNGFRMSRQNQSIVDAVNPDDVLASLSEAVPNPSSFLMVNPRVDFQLGKINTITIRDSFFRSVATGSGVGTLNLPEQGNDTNDKENTLQIGDTMILSPKLLNETHFQWRRIRNNQFAEYLIPTVTVQGAFTTGGNSSGVFQDHEDIFELQNYWTATAKNQTLRFGTRLRAYRDANYSTSGANGTYNFDTLVSYEAAAPVLYSQTVINNPLARVLLFDGSLFFQDDWRWKPNFMVGVGIRYEAQNRIHDHADWAPRIAVAWSPSKPGKTPPKTVVRAGYGWFYNRFTVPTSFFSSAGAPYIVQAIHNNLINQRSYVINSPNFYDPGAPESPGLLGSAAASVPTYDTVDPHFHAALDMQGGIGVDQQITKKITGNITYLYTQGTHQYFTNNVTAPDFDPDTYTVNGPTPSIYNYQFQSEGFYRQQQVIVTGSVRFKHFGLNGNYSYNEAKSDTQGVNSFPSVAQDPGLDYGRASFAIRHRVFMLGTITAPYAITFAPLLAAQSGTPYNLTIGEDLTANNQFNARPTYGACGAPDVVTTRYGCLDTNPVAKGERMVPYNVATGPANVVFHMRVSKVIGVGPREKNGEDDKGIQASQSVSGRGLSSGGAAIHLDASAPRKYKLTFVAVALNLFNVVNLGTPNGVLDSRLFNQTQSLANGPFGNPTPGNRAILLQANFSF
jgi:Carboxypeptidase regulatory-like domain